LASSTSRLSRFVGIPRRARAFGDLYMFTRKLFSVYSACPVKCEAYFTGVGSSEPERREGERARDEKVCVRLRGSAVKGFNELTNSLINLVIN